MADFNFCYFVILKHTAFKDKRADSIVPEAFLKQRPRRGDGDVQEGPLTPPSSPPHDAYNSADEGEGEAIFSGTPLTQTKSPRRSPSRTDDFDDDTPPAKKAKIESGQIKNPPPPPPPKSKEGKHGQSRPPPPPPPRRQVSGPPPPSQSPAQTSSSIEDQSSPGTTNGNGKPPPPALSQPPGSATKKTALPPAKTLPRPKQAAPPTQPSQQRDQQERRRSLSQASQNNAMDMQSADKKPSVDLPEGWICVWSKSQKRWYFFNTKNNKSVWQWPPPP